MADRDFMVGLRSENGGIQHIKVKADLVVRQGEHDQTYWKVSGDGGQTMLISSDAFVYAAPDDMIIEA